MGDNEILDKLKSKEIVVGFTTIDNFKVFLALLNSNYIHTKNDAQYYWEKYKTELGVVISDKGNFKCASLGFYREQGRCVVIYDRKPNIIKFI